MTPKPNTTLRDALHDACPAPPLPDSLTTRVAALATASDAARAPRLAHRRRIGLRVLATAATFLLVAALLMPPRLTPALAFQRMKASLRSVRSVHYVVWGVLPNGTRVRDNEIWYQSGNWRTEDYTFGKVQVCRQGVRWTYDSETNVIARDNAAFPAGIDYEWSKQPTATASYGGAIQKPVTGTPTEVSPPGSARIAGRPAHTILVNDPVYDGQTLSNRSIVTVDDATDLPIKIERQTLAPGASQWTTRSIYEQDYNRKLSASLFVPDFPKTAQLFDVVADREQWRKRLERGIASQQVGKVSFVIADFEVNADGDVFLLMAAHTTTASYKMPPYRIVELTDEFGTRYINPASQQRARPVFLPTCMDSDPGCLFHSGYMEGRWWVPLQKRATWKPRRFKLTLRLDPGRKNEDCTTVFELPVARAEAKDVPGYMPYMARSLSGANLAADDAETRGYYLWHHAHALPQALAAYQEAIALRNAYWHKMGLPRYNAYQWFDIYQILLETGRTAEARDALLRAKADDDRALFAPETRPWIQAAMKKEGLTP